MGGIALLPCHTPAWAGQCQSQTQPWMEAGELTWRENEGRKPAPQALAHCWGQRPQLTVPDRCHPLAYAPSPTSHHEQRWSLGRGVRADLK